MVKRKVRDLVRELKDAIQQELPEDVEAVISLDIRLNTLPVETPTLQKSAPSKDIEELEEQLGLETEAPEPDAEKPVEKPEPDAENTSDEEPAPADLDGLRAALNAYVRATNKETAFELIKKYTGNSLNPADIPPEVYQDIIDDMAEVELFPNGEAV